MIGGLVPLIKAGRDRHVVESTWWLKVTWMRTLVSVRVTR